MRKAAILGALLVSGAVAMAQTPADAPTTKRGPSNDPNEVICINQAEIGSRVSRRRVCRTRAQWEEVNAQTRQVVERVQLNKQTTGQ